LGEDLELLRDEFVEYAGTGDATSDAGDVELWPEPVDTRALVTEVVTQFKGDVVVHDNAELEVTLWVRFGWVHGDVAVHSPILAFTGAEADTGKTTAVGVIKFLTPRAYSGVELTGPALFRFVDRMRPTLTIDDADQLFERKTDLRHIVNAGWTRGTLIPRQGPGGVTLWFNPFCAKVLAGMRLALPKTTASRTIIIRLMPKLPDEKISDFNHADDDTFIPLRRKLMRWAADNAQALKDACPILPTGFANRPAMNWRLLLAIADLAGDKLAKDARAAAIKLSRQRQDPSQG